jgi:threonine/homoserine/homoserine lactone efflux protein
MLFSVVAVVTAFIDNAQHSELITLGTLPTVAISILVLLALSSHRARNYAARQRRRRRQEGVQWRDETDAPHRAGNG